LSGRVVRDIKPPTDTKSLTFDFTSEMAIAETISTKTVTATVFSGTDANPSAIVSGAATHNGQQVFQLITAGVLGVVYTLLCTITTSAGQTLTQACYLAIMKEAVQ